MKLVILESPWRGDTLRNRAYAAECVRDSVCRGESPYASHVMLTEALDDNDSTERAWGIACGYAWWPHAEVVVFYTDLGWSEGMTVAWVRAQSRGIHTEERRLADYKDRDDGAGQPQPE